jgi:hypothetical protein
LKRGGFEMMETKFEKGNIRSLFELLKLCEAEPNSVLMSRNVMRNLTEINGGINNDERNFKIEDIQEEFILRVSRDGIVHEDKTQIYKISQV